jgi:cysteine desulfurase
MWPEVRELYVDTLATVGNPSSIHRDGQAARALIDEARAELAELVGADPMEVTFTSGATEAINTWLKGRVFAERKARGSGGSLPRLVIPRSEHHATLDAVAWLESQGFARVDWLQVDSQARVDLDHLEYLLANSDGEPVTGVSLLAANNEVGTLQPVDEVVALAGSRDVPVHVDAVGMFGHLPWPFGGRGLDAMSISAHKVGGPVGVGALVRSRMARPLEGLVHGGSQQTHRSGTLDAAGAVAFARAARLTLDHLEQEAVRLARLRDRLREGLGTLDLGITFRGDVASRLPHNLHITVSGCEGDVLLYLLDERGISVSTGSACQAGVAEPSHVLVAMGLNESQARGALRFTLGRDNTDADIDRVIAVFPEVVEMARRAAR